MRFACLLKYRSVFIFFGVQVLGKYSHCIFNRVLINRCDGTNSFNVHCDSFISLDIYIYIYIVAVIFCFMLSGIYHADERPETQLSDVVRSKKERNEV